MPALRIYFNGMCGFVAESEERMTVLLPDLKRHPHHPHQPALVFRQRDVIGPISRCDRLDDYDLDYGNLCIWNLQYEHLDLMRCNEAGGTCAPFPSSKIEADRGTMPKGNRLPSDLNEAQDFKWIPSMKDLTGEGYPLNTALTSDIVTHPKSLIIARMRIPSGTFACAEIAREPHDAPDIYAYKFKTKDHECTLEPQALAELVFVQIPFFDGTIQVISRKLHESYEDSQETHRVTFRGNGPPVINIGLVNVPLPPDSKDDKFPRAKGHFVKYYDLLKPAPGKGHKYTPHLVKNMTRTMDAASIPNMLRFAPKPPDEPSEQNSEIRSAHNHHGEHRESKKEGIDKKIKPKSVRNESLCPFVQFP